MGPIIIFDKSLLESLSIDESCWLEMFFTSNITPLFFIETLADLEKTPKSGRTIRSAEEIVGELAAKTPAYGSHPNTHHETLMLNELLFGLQVELSNRIIVPSGILKRTEEGQIGVHFDRPPELEAFERWQKEQFSDIERDYAKRWRKDLSDINFDLNINKTKNIIPYGKKFSSLSEIKAFVDEVIQSDDIEFLYLLFDILNIPKQIQKLILERWEKANTKSLVSFAPYAAYIFSIELFFYISLYFKLIAKERASNKIDLAYLYYLPFCMVFVSSDKLHKRTVPLFINSDQSFIDGAELKKGLKLLDEYYSSLPEEIKDQGLMKFATHPPTEVANIVNELWEKHMKPSSKHKESLEQGQSVRRQRANDFIDKNAKQLDHLEETAIPIDRPIDFTSDNADYLITKMVLPIKKGKWRYISKDVEDDIKQSKESNNEK